METHNKWHAAIAHPQKAWVSSKSLPVNGKVFVAPRVNDSNQFNGCEYSFILILDWCSAGKRSMN